MTIRLMLCLAILLSGCAEIKAFTMCSLAAGVANQRSYTFNGTVNGQKYKDTVAWTAGATDPNFMDPLDCTSMVVRRWKEQENQSATKEADTQFSETVK